MGIDRERIVVDRASSTLRPPITDDRVALDFEDVERRAAAEIQDDHLLMVGSRLHLEGHCCTEDRFVESDRPIHIGGQRGHMVEPGCHRHRALASETAAPYSVRIEEFVTH